MEKEFTMKDLEQLVERTVRINLYYNKYEYNEENVMEEMNRYNTNYNNEIMRKLTKNMDFESECKKLITFYYTYLTTKDSTYKQHAEIKRLTFMKLGEVMEHEEYESLTTLNRYEAYLKIKNLRTLPTIRKPKQRKPEKHIYSKDIGVPDEWLS